MRRKLSLYLLLLALVGPPVILWATQEAVSLTTPIAQLSISSYAPGSLFIQVSPTPRVVVTLVGTDGRGLVFEYPCTNGCTSTDTTGEVTTLISALNVANLSTRSLWRRVFDRLVTDFPERFPGGATVQ